MTPLRYGMKAAVRSGAQLADRAARLDRLGLEVIIELHTFGDGDLDTPAGFAACLAGVRRLRERWPARLTVHVPYQQPAVVTATGFDRGQVARTVEFALAAGADGVVVHRYYGIVRGGDPVRVPRADAEELFYEEVRRLAADLGERRGMVENLGFFWLRPPDAGRYLTGALDHFFPWEMERLRRRLAADGIGNVEPMVDVAHATLSANMFNLLRRHYATFRQDPRFQGITDADLDRAGWLTPYDFLATPPAYAHVSDAVLLGPGEVPGPPAGPPGAGLVWTALTSESLPLGEGNLDPDAIVAPWCAGAAGRPGGRAGGGPPGPLLVAEVDPWRGGDHTANAAQEAAILRLMDAARRATAGMPRRQARPAPSPATAE